MKTWLWSWVSVRGVFSVSPLAAEGGPVVPAVLQCCTAATFCKSEPADPSLVTLLGSAAALQLTAVTAHVTWYFAALTRVFHIILGGQSSVRCCGLPLDYLGIKQSGIKGVFALNNEMNNGLVSMD